MGLYAKLFSWKQAEFQCVVDNLDQEINYSCCMNLSKSNPTTKRFKSHSEEGSCQGIGKSIGL